MSDGQFSSLDCLALGFLSLMLTPELPQPWLAKTMKKKFPNLCTWVQDLRKEIFSASVSLNDAFLTKLGDSELDIRLKRLRAKGHLPWKAADNGGALGAGTAFVSSVADSMPIVGQLRRNTRMRQHGGRTSDDDTQSISWQHLGLIGSFIAGLGLVAGYMFHEGLLPYGKPVDEPEKGKGLDSFGEAGEALSFLSMQMDDEAARQRRMAMSSTPYGEPVVELDIEVDTANATASDRIT